MADWTFELQCPRCGKQDQLATKNNDTPPTVNCGDCLMDDVKIVEMEIIKATVDVSSGRRKA